MLRVPATPYRLALVCSLFAAAACGSGDITIPQDGLPAHITMVSGDGQSGTVGQPVADSLIVRVTDSKDRPVKDQLVGFVMTAGGTVGLLIPDTLMTDADGRARALWQLGEVAGAQKVEARVVARGHPGTLAAEFTATAAAEAADTMIRLLGDGQLGVVNSTLAESLVVVVTDEYLNPVAGQQVTWAVQAGQGSVSPAVVTTGSDGRAAVARTLGPSSGTQTATATVAGLKGSPVRFTSTASSGGVVRLVKLYGDGQPAPAGQQLTESIVVQAQDANGNGVPGQAVVWVVTTSSGGSFSGGTNTTDAQGKAFVFWTLSTTAGPNTLTAAIAGLPQVTFTATGTAAQAARLAVQGTPSTSGTAGLPVLVPPAVRVTDNLNNPVQGVF